MAREFIIQRYASGNWPMLRGQRPFVVTGPSFKQWVVPGSLSRLGRWLIRPDLLESVRSAFPVGRTHRDDRLALAEVLLTDGIVQALWVTDSPTCIPVEQRWPVALSEVAAESTGGFQGEVSATFDLASELSWGLSTLPGPEVPRSYLIEDGLSLEVMAVSVTRA